IPSVGQGVWRLISGSATFTDSTSAVNVADDLVEGQNVLSWTITNGPCPASTDSVIIIRDVIPEEANAIDDFSACADTVTLNASLPSGANGIWALISGEAQIEADTSEVTTVWGLEFGENIFEW